MTMRMALQSLALATTTAFIACGGTTPIGASESTMIDPDEGLPEATIQITNSSADINAPGIPTNADIVNMTIGQFSSVAYGRMTQTDEVEVCNTGSAGGSDIKNLRLFAGTIQIGQTVETLVGKCARFPFTTPITQDIGQVVNYLLRADIVAGVNRYAQFNLVNPTSLVAHDRAGNSAQVVLNTGDWPMKMSYITINQGYLVATQAPYFTDRIIPTATTYVGTMAVASFAAHGEAIRLTSMSVKLYFGNGLSANDLAYVGVVDDVRGPVCVGTATTPSTNPRLHCSNLNVIINNGTVGYEMIQATFRAGAQGTVQACLSDVTAQGFTSLSSITIPKVCGNVMIVGP